MVTNTLLKLPLGALQVGGSDMLVFTVPVGEELPPPPPSPQAATISQIKMAAVSRKNEPISRKAFFFMKFLQFGVIRKTIQNKDVCPVRVFVLQGN
jgi:hypothetical protein